MLLEDTQDCICCIFLSQWIINAVSCVSVTVENLQRIRQKGLILTVFEQVKHKSFEPVVGWYPVEEPNRKVQVCCMLYAVTRSHSIGSDVDLYKV